MCDVQSLAEELLADVQKMREEMEAVVRAGERRASYLQGAADALQGVANRLMEEEKPEVSQDSEPPD